MLPSTMDLPAINDYFKSVIDLIPAHSYFNQSNSTPVTNGFGKKRKLPVTKKPNHAKKAKLRPNFLKTTSAQITDHDEGFNEMVSASKKHSDDSPKSAQSLTDLQQRLKDRIAQIQDQRKPKNKSQEEIVRIRARRKKEKAKLKIRAKLKREQAFKTGSTMAEMRGKPGQKQATDTNGLPKPTTSNGQAVFSKFDFGKDNDSKKRKNKFQKKNDLRSLLIQAEAKKQRIESMKESEPEKAETMMKKENWGKALAKAEGTKLKDNPEMLKKSLKKEQAIKKRHAKTWNERESKVEDKMRQKQEKRVRNIQARKDQVKNKKMAKRAKKMAKSVPGF